MGFITLEVKELTDIFLKNIKIPDIITKIEADKNEVTVKVKPAAFLPKMSLKFTITSAENKLSILFDQSKTLIVYGFLLGKLKDEKIEGIQLFKDRLEIDFQKLLKKNIKDVKIKMV